jgi:hypothetical protein
VRVITMSEDAHQVPKPRLLSNPFQCLNTTRHDNVALPSTSAPLHDTCSSFNSYQTPLLCSRDGRVSSIPAHTFPHPWPHWTQLSTTHQTAPPHWPIHARARHHGRGAHRSRCTSVSAFEGHLMLSSHSKHSSTLLSLLCNSHTKQRRSLASFNPHQGRSRAKECLVVSDLAASPPLLSVLLDAALYSI